MHRSGSTTRASDEFYLTSHQGGGGRSSLEVDQLPTYDPQSDVSKKEASKVKFAENMVHLIPLVLILCAIVLWLFSHPEIDVASKDESILARVKNMTIEGYSNWNGSSTIGVEDLDPVDGIGTEDPGAEFANKNPA